MNRLTGEASAYLRSAAHQPIHWYPWGPEALQAARDQDRPILLDIGAVWCHWCHVMDGESYDDPSLAALINDRFIPVKVDRDERPDVDARYQKAVGALTGQGGWPLTGFLLPDGRVFYGGTYFPPDDRHGRPSFRRVLAAVADAYRDRKDQVLQQADALAAHLEPTPPNGAAVPSEWTTAGLDQILQHMDPVQGGWGHAPKFPHPSALEALLAAHETRPDPRWSSALISTLDGMARGGIRDHVGGGFHRYSVDERWHVPHFEKMLYDNAELLRDYAHAFRVLGRPRFRDVALDTMRFLQETLSDQQRGGFYGSQDADVSFGDDGDYFTWTKQELRDAVGEERLARLLELRYGVEARGPMHHDPAKNVLHEAADLEALAEAQGRPLAAVRADLAQGLDLLRKARAARKAPFVDPVLYTNWNGMAIRACLEAGPILGRPDAAAFALRTLDRFLAEATPPSAASSTRSAAGPSWACSTTRRRCWWPWSPPSTTRRSRGSSSVRARWQTSSFATTRRPACRAWPTRPTGCAPGTHPRRCSGSSVPSRTRQAPAPTRAPSRACSSFPTPPATNATAPRHGRS
jgi:uncharacterized protein